MNPAPASAAVKVDGAPEIGRAEPTAWSVFEQAGFPTRFEIRYPDPDLQLWNKAAQVVGAGLSVDLGSGPKAAGKVWGRRLVRDFASGGTVLVLNGFDASYALHAVRQFRSFGSVGLKGAAEQLAGAAGLKVAFGELAGRAAGASAPLVQYGETALQFLRRHARLMGLDVWPYRGELHIGPGPGAGKSAALDLNPAGSGAAEFVLEETWVDEAGGDCFPRAGTPFAGAPNLSAAGTTNPATKSAAPALDRIGLKEPFPWPAGHAVASGDPAQLAKKAAAARAAARVRGAVPLAGPPPESLVPGCTATLRAGAAVLAEGVLVVGLTHVSEGQSRQTIVQFGRPGDLDDPLPDLRPARHLWPAVIAGKLEARVGSVLVNPLGWHPESKPLPARLTATSAVRDAGTLHPPTENELVLIGFEGGNSDAPVVLGALYDTPSPNAATALWVLRQPGGGELRVTAAQGKLGVELVGLELTVTGDKPVAVTAGDKITLKAPNIKLDK